MSVEGEPKGMQLTERGSDQLPGRTERSGIVKVAKRIFGVIIDELEYEMDMKQRLGLGGLFGFGRSREEKEAERQEDRRNNIFQPGDSEEINKAIREETRRQAQAQKDAEREAEREARRGR